MKAYLLFSFLIVSLPVARSQSCHCAPTFPKGRVCLRSENFPDRFIALTDRQALIKTPGPKYFQLVQALAGKDFQPAVSFKSLDVPNHYLRHRNWFLYADPISNTASFQTASSYFVQKNQWFSGYYSFESVDFPGYYVRHRNAKVRISEYDGTDVFKRDASFKIESC